MTKLKIYFASSIRGIASNEANIKEIINILTRYGEVLNEKIEWTHSSNENPPSDEVIYSRDMGFLDTANILVADVSAPSLGVGYEICYMLSLNKPVICIWNSKIEKISAIINGNSRIPKNYRYTYNLPNEIATFLGQILPEIFECYKLPLS